MSPIDDNPENYALFRDCLSTTLLQPAATPDRDPPKRRRRRRASDDGGVTAAGPANRALDPGQDAEELADFVDYLATEIFESLPAALQALDYRAWRDDEALQREYAPPLTKDNLTSLNPPPSVAETLAAYNLIGSDDGLPSSLEAFLAPVLTSYMAPLTSPPACTRSSRTDACELCGRSWIPLSYHHLIPRFVHEKAVRRGWHRREDLQNVAWLCGACHRFVHHFRGHEELARSYYTVGLLLEEDEVRRWAAWVGRLRWKGGKIRSGR